MVKHPGRRGLPTSEALLSFIRDSAAPVGKREIARAFAVQADERRDLDSLLRALEEAGHIGRGPNKRFTAGDHIPEVMVLEVSAIDGDGEVLARPAGWRGEGKPPRIYVVQERRGPAPAPGDRVLARLRRLEHGIYSARVMRRLEAQPKQVLGVFRAAAPGAGGGGWIKPTNRRIRTEFAVHARDTADAAPGDLVSAEVLPGRSLGLPTAKIVERLGDMDQPGAASLIAIHANGIPVEFPTAALRQAERARPAPAGGRTDLRALPLVTIDDEDARDFDDAVWAGPDDDPDNPGGWHLCVAIADVAWYVRPGDPLDTCARERGNSVYFPDRVVPMLPEALSNGLCSLKPREDRACLVADIWIDAAGQKRRHFFRRAMMRSAARLTYRRMQNARDGRLPADDPDADVLALTTGPLYGAYDSLRRARRTRGTIDLELPERRVIMTPDRHRIERIEKRPRYDSHRLIEEFMILANVCAAETLEAARQPVMYRVHDQPPPDRVVALRRYLETLGFRLAGGQAVRPRHFAQLLGRIGETPHARAVNEAILRTQSQAVYSPENLGHFGLSLRRYSHFTSPIRRYADLLVHRALIGGLGFGEGGLEAGTGEAFVEVGAHLSMTERRAMAAEREAGDRLLVAYLSDRVGATFEARITGVERFGMFVVLEDTGADGLLPLSALGEDDFRLDETGHFLRGRRSRETFRLGDPVRVRLADADRVTGGLLFALPDREPRAPQARTYRRPEGPRGRSGRPAPRRR
jgi:ribonuclease R